MNYYVMDQNSVMMHRDTLEGCKAWCEQRVKQYRDFGMRSPIYRVFYDSGTKPVCQFGQGYDGMRGAK